MNRRIKNPGVGCARRGDGASHGDTLRIVCSFDAETFSQIRTRAVRSGTSFAEQVRLLTEWGLEIDVTAAKGSASSRSTGET